MRVASQFLLMLVGLTLAAPGFAAKDPMKNAIKARQGEMQLRAFNVGPLFAMAKGKIEYDAKLAAGFADNLKLMLDLDNGRAWAEGSGNDKYKKTTALPKIWSTYPEVTKYNDRYIKAVSQLAAVAGNGRDALKAKIGAVGKSCKGCHDEFREKQ